VRRRLIPLALTAALWPVPAGAEGPREVPDFHAESGDQEVLTRSRVRGKVLLIWYEADGEQDINQALKFELKTFNTTRLTRPYRLLVIPFADVSRIIWPFTAVARSKLQDISKEIGLTVYGDWDGSVQTSFRFPRGQPSVLIADDKGVIRWRAEGKVPAEKYGEIKALIKALVDGS
jgi:hypothetical protein